MSKILLWHDFFRKNLINAMELKKKKKQTPNITPVLDLIKPTVVKEVPSLYKWNWQVKTWNLDPSPHFRHHFFLSSDMGRWSSFINLTPSPLPLSYARGFHIFSGDNTFWFVHLPAVSVAASRALEVLTPVAHSITHSGILSPQDLLHAAIPQICHLTKTAQS